MSTPAQFKDYFDRGQFTYGASVPSIRDKDITSAIAEANAVFNPSLYPDEMREIAFMYLTAHYLLLDVSASFSGGAPSFVQTSRSADGISEAVHLPAWMIDGDFAFYATTYYGQKWLYLTSPYLGGAISAVGGATRP